MLGKHCTATATIYNVLTVIYHETPIVRVFHDRIMLDSGGYLSATTKRRMNQASDDHNLGYQVYQKRFAWYASYKGKNYEFVAGKITLPKVKHD